MSSTKLMSLIEELLPRGQQTLRETMRELLRHAAPDAAVGDDELLDPLLFAWFTSPGPEGSLEALLTVRRPARMVIESDVHPLLQRFFADESGTHYTVDVRGTARRHRAHVRRAWKIIGRIAPEVSAAISSVTRRVLVFHCPAMNSFASPQAPGIAFLNAALGQDEVFFVEDLVHQCGHIVFAAMSIDRSRFLGVESTRPMALVHGRGDDPRTVYDALHGLFTEGLIALVLARCADMDVFRGRQQHELQGRLAMILRRYRGDLDDLAHPGIFTSAGRDLFCILHAVFVEIAAARETLVRGCDLSNQDYNFDYQRFAEVNPLPVARCA